MLCWVVLQKNSRAEEVELWLRHLQLVFQKGQKREIERCRQILLRRTQYDYELRLEVSETNPLYAVVKYYKNKYVPK
jgi:hypothetical protein